MALIIFPALNADSFISVAEADLYISLLTMNTPEWMLLSNEDKERLLRIAYRDIIDHTEPDTYPTPLPVCVGESQALMASHDNINSISSGVVSTTVTGALKKQKVGSIEQQFYDTKSTDSARSVTRVPEAARKCLLDLGYAFTPTSTKFKQDTLGRS